MAYLYYFLSSIAITLLLLLGTRELFDSLTLKRENYRGALIPSALGGIIVITIIVVELGMVLMVRTGALEENWNVWWDYSFMVLISGIALLGLIDDIGGRERVSGFRGHILAIGRGRITSGFIKAGAGFALSMIAVNVFSNSLGELFLNTFLVALTINLINLLDKRPGRAIKGFWLLYVVVVITNRGLDSTFLNQSASVLASSLVLFPGDMRERFMLGDTGSNVLGATVGLGLALGLANWPKLGFVLALLLLNVLSEFYSFSRAIERSSIIRFIDRLGGIPSRRVEGP